METENSTKTVDVERLKPYQFKPGQSGNPGGRPRNPLKEFSLKEFSNWTDKEKLDFLKKITPIDRWKMTEGNPSSETELKGEVTTKIISVDE
mgnify:CR=1 FL=1